MALPLTPGSGGRQFYDRGRIWPFLGLTASNALSASRVFRATGDGAAKLANSSVNVSECISTSP